MSSFFGMNFMCMHFSQFSYLILSFSPNSSLPLSLLSSLSYRYIYIYIRLQLIVPMNSIQHIQIWTLDFILRFIHIVGFFLSCVLFLSYGISRKYHTLRNNFKDNIYCYLPYKFTMFFFLHQMSWKTTQIRNIINDAKELVKQKQKKTHQYKQTMTKSYTDT